MSEQKNYVLPTPIIDCQEEQTVKALAVRYGQMQNLNLLSKAGKKLSGVVPTSIKNLTKNVAGSISEAELYQQAMNVIAEGFKVIEEQAAKFSISEETIIKKVNGIVPDNEITELDEICLARSYDLARLVNQYKSRDLLAAAVEGGATGAFGFAGLPFNLVLSTFLFYRAVQSIAMFYGYDVKNDTSELIIASEVFVSALSPQKSGSSEIGSLIGRIMLISELTAVKQTSKKTWEAMASQGGIALLLTQMRALAHKSAKTALEKAGQKGLENSIFRRVFQQIGRGLTKKSIQRVIPVVSAAIGVCFDTAQMHTVLEFADVFYQKRYLAEKEIRICALTEKVEEDYIDVAYETASPINC